MKIFIIAQLVSDDGKNVLGYRLLDVDNKNQVRDYPANNVKQVLANPETSDIIKNAKLIDGNITGTNGQLSRYPKVNQYGKVVGNSSLVVLNKIDNVGYTVCDFKGQVKKMKNSDVVEYAKTSGIANGKVVIQDNVEYISSISDTYEQISISPSKTGKQGRVNISINMSGDVKSIAEHTANDINTELQYNDVFSAMTPQQRNVLKQFYTWYTVDVYQSLAKNVRLNLAPGKAEKLAQLRGIDKWKFAGVNDSYLEGRFDAKCELGHSLRYEYYAIPEDNTSEVSYARTMDWHNYAFRTTKGAQDDLKENGAIVFGETCAGDFFNIAPEDMKKLVKTRKIMSEEIELMADIITNKQEALYANKCKFLYDCLKELNTPEAIVKVFGEKVGYTLMAFIKVQLPFPKSLVVLAGDQARKNISTFYSQTFIDYKDILTVSLTDKDPRHYASRDINTVLKYIVDYTIEGDYQYDPVNDTNNSRRDIGAYNKKTRQEREYLNKCVYSASLLSVYDKSEDNINNIENVKKYFSCIDKASKICARLERYIDNSELLKDKADINFVKTLIYFAENTDNNISDTDLGYINSVISCLSMSKKYAGYSKITTNIRYTYGRYRSRSYIKSLDELVDVISLAYDNLSIDELISRTIGLYENKLAQDKKEEEERDFNRYTYFRATVNKEPNSSVIEDEYPIRLRTTTEDESQSDVLIEANGALKIQLRDVISGKNTDDFNIPTYMAGEVKASEITTMREINNAEYSTLKLTCDEIVRRRKSKQREAELLKKEEERKQREELEKQEAAKKEAEKEEQRQKDFQNDTKMSKLKELLDNYPKENDDYGITVARNILSKQIPYAELSSKQQWRINETIKQLENNNDKKSNNNDDNADNTLENNVPTKKRLTDSPEVNNKVEKLYEILKGKDKETYEKVVKASRIAFDIVKTVKYKGEYSDKQLKHIEKAFDAIQ
jgi:hypothetical protein